MNSRQIGKLRINQVTIDEYPDVVADALGKIRFIPLRCEAIHYSRQIEMVGIGEPFEEVPLGGMIQNYELLFEVDEEGQVRFQKVERRQP